MSRASDFYHRHFLWIELVLAAVATFAFWGGTRLVSSQDLVTNLLTGNRHALYGGIVTLTGSLLGFVIAAVPIILGFAQMPRLKVVRDSTQYPEVFRLFFQAIYWLSLAAIGALVSLLTDTDATPRC